MAQHVKRSARKRKTYFFSDAHLGLGSKEDDRKKERRIIEFLEAVKKDGEQLFIVGDLFDYWFEYKTVVPKGYFRLFTKLAELTERGIKISYLVGNHDFWIKRYFHDELGIEIAFEPFERTIHGKRFLIHHGDGLVKNDMGYRILKKILRSKINIFLFSLVHTDITGRLAQWSSRTSRKHTSNRAFEVNDLIEFARNKIQAEGIDVVIMGHNHRSHFEKFQRGIYINLGDWIHENAFAVFDGKNITLKHWHS